MGRAPHTPDVHRGGVAVLQDSSGLSVALVPMSGGFLSSSAMARALTSRGIPAAVSSVADLSQPVALVTRVVLLDVEVECRPDEVAARCEVVRSALPDARLLLLLPRGVSARPLTTCGADGTVTRDVGLDGLVTAIKAIASGRVSARTRTLVPRQRDEAKQAVASLTAREREVLRLVATGAPNSEVANSLQISPHTVRTHVQNVLAKLGAENRLVAAAMARRAGILASGPQASTYVGPLR